MAEQSLGEYALTLYGSVFVLISIVWVCMDCLVFKTKTDPRENAKLALIFVFWPVFVLLSPWLIKRRWAAYDLHRERCEHQDHAECKWWRERP